MQLVHVSPPGSLVGLAGNQSLLTGVLKIINGTFPLSLVSTSAGKLIILIKEATNN